MKNLMSVKEMKEILAKYNDDDVLMIEGGEGCDGDWAQMGIAQEVVYNFDDGKCQRWWEFKDILFELYED